MQQPKLAVCARAYHDSFNLPFITLQICTVFKFVPLSAVISLSGLHLIALYSPMYKLQ